MVQAKPRVSASGRGQPPASMALARGDGDLPFPSPIRNHLGLKTAGNLANVGLDVSRQRFIKIQFECELVHTSPPRIGFLIFVALSTRMACTAELRRLNELVNKPLIMNRGIDE